LGRFERFGQLVVHACGDAALVVADQRVGSHGDDRQPGVASLSWGSDPAGAIAQGSSNRKVLSAFGVLSTLENDWNRRSRSAAKAERYYFCND
jgi:hypothetical protein